MNKKENAKKLGDTRFKPNAHQYAVVPGGPMSTNPVNMDVGPHPSSFGGTKSLYLDYLQDYAQLGADAVNPFNTPPSGLQQNFPQGQRMNNVPFGLQQQPDIAGVSPTPERMETARQAQNAEKLGLQVNAMGMTGLPAQPAPGAFPAAFPGSNGPPMLQGMPSAEQAAGKGMNTRTGKRA